MRVPYKDYPGCFSVVIRDPKVIDEGVEVDEMRLDTVLDKT